MTYTCVNETSNNTNNARNTYSNTATGNRNRNRKCNRSNKRNYNEAASDQISAIAPLFGCVERNEQVTRTDQFPPKSAEIGPTLDNFGPESTALVPFRPSGATLDIRII